MAFNNGELEVAANHDLPALSKPRTVSASQTSAASPSDSCCETCDVRPQQVLWLSSPSAASEGTAATSYWPLDLPKRRESVHELEASELCHDNEVTPMRSATRVDEITKPESFRSDLDEEHDLNSTSNSSVSSIRRDVSSPIEEFENGNESSSSAFLGFIAGDSDDLVFDSNPDNLPDELPSSITETNLYNITPIPGKGLGAVAATAITKGTQILAEAPQIRLNHTRWDIPETPESQFDQLGDDDKRRVLSLYNYREDKGPLTGIIYTNAIPLQGRYPESGLFVEASRINHACKPNTIHTWNAKTNELVTYATHDIAKGEEITSSYINGFAPYAFRQRHLNEVFGFICQCRLCSLAIDERVRSDERILKINRLRDKLHELSLRSRPIPTLKYVRELLELYHEEGVVDDQPRDAYLLAEKVTARGRDWRRLVVFAERRKDLEAAFGGPTDDEEADTLENAMRRIIGKDWRETSRKGGGLWPEVDENFENWLFLEDEWYYKFRNKYPSIHMLEQDLEPDISPGEEEWEVVRPQKSDVPKSIW